MMQDAEQSVDKGYRNRLKSPGGNEDIDRYSGGTTSRGLWRQKHLPRNDMH